MVTPLDMRGSFNSLAGGVRRLGALRLTTLLAEHPVGAVPETFALLALMHFHAARLSGRVDGAGGLLLLEERARWDGAHRCWRRVA